MKKIALGAMLVLGLAVGAGHSASAGPGDGLDKNAVAQGNGRTGGMHHGAMSRRMMMPRHHMRHHRHRRHR